MRMLIAIIAACLLLGSVPAVAVAAEGSEMGTNQAGRYYMKTVCPANRVFDRYWEQLFKGRERVTVREIRARLPELRRLSDRVSRAFYKAARRMYNPPESWPETIKEPIIRIANTYADQAYLHERASRTRNAGTWIRLTDRADGMSSGNAPVRVRAYLDLPEPGRGC